MLAELYIFLDGQKLKTFTHNGEKKIEWDIFEFDYLNNLITLKEGATFIYANKSIKQMKGENKIYTIQKEDCYYRSYLFPYQNKENFYNYHYYCTNNLSLNFGGDTYLSKVALTIKDKKIETNCGAIYLNGIKNSKKEIKVGEEISILAHRIIVLNNGFLVNDIAKTLSPSSLIIKSKKIKEKYTYSYLTNWPNSPPQPQYLSFLDKKDFVQDDVLKAIGPQLSLALAMLIVTGFNVYQNYIRNNNLISSLPILILPISMSFTTLFWPLLFRHKERKKYLKEEKKRMPLN